jgi:hypothetical protein
MVQFPWWKKQQVFLKRRYASIRLHIISDKTEIFVFNAVRTSNLTKNETSAVARSQVLDTDEAFRSNAVYVVIRCLGGGGVLYMNMEQGWNFSPIKCITKADNRVY